MVRRYSVAEVNRYRAMEEQSFEESCAIVTVHDTTGALTDSDPVACRIDRPSASSGGEWMGDLRSVEIVLPWDAAVGDNDLIRVNGATYYRVQFTIPERTHTVRRRVNCIEDRSPGGPV